MSRNQKTSFIAALIVGFVPIIQMPCFADDVASPSTKIDVSIGSSESKSYSPKNAEEVLTETSSAKKENITTNEVKLPHPTNCLSLEEVEEMVKMAKLRAEKRRLDEKPPFHLPFEDKVQTAN